MGNNCTCHDKDDLLGAANDGSQVTKYSSDIESKADGVTIGSSRIVPTAQFDALVANSPVLVATKAWCPYCKQVEALLESKGVKYTSFQLEDAARNVLVHNERELLTHMAIKDETRLVPQVFIGGVHIGGAEEFFAMNVTGELRDTLEKVGALASNASDSTMDPGEADYESCREGETSPDDPDDDQESDDDIFALMVEVDTTERAMEAKKARVAAEARALREMQQKREAAARAKADRRAKIEAKRKEREQRWGSWSGPKRKSMLERFTDAIEAEDLEKCSVLLEMGVSPKATVDKDEHSLLHAAVSKKNVAIIELLFDYGADPAQQMKNGCTALHIATKEECPCTIVETLLEDDPDGVALSLLDRRKNTPAAYAKGPLKEILVSAEANVRHKAAQGADKFEPAGNLHNFHSHESKSSHGTVKMSRGLTAVSVDIGAAGNESHAVERKRKGKSHDHLSHEAASCAESQAVDKKKKPPKSKSCPEKRAKSQENGSADTSEPKAKPVGKGKAKTAAGKRKVP